MSTRSERDRAKATQEKHQAILTALLKDEDNKYCVDCDAKGPRWASWNLGIFLCIRCAGIHRNLGVHISKVKSVNLDTWTPEQIAMMVDMGNSRARAVYEANLPDGYRRPQTDSPLEAFIRAKYEQKKWIAKEWVPPKPRVQVSNNQPIEDDRREKKKTKAVKNNIQLGNVSRPKPTESKPAAQPQPAPQKPPPAKPSATDDLLGLDTPSQPITNTTTNNSSAANDLFGDFLGAPIQSTPTSSNQNTTQATSMENSLFGETEQSKSTKDSIMALFGSQPNPQPQQQQQQYGIPGGMYMAQQPQQYGGMMGMQQGMMGHPQQQQQQLPQMGMMPGTMGMQSNMMGMQGMQGMQPMGGMAMTPMQSQMYNMQQSQQMYMQQVQQQLAGMSLSNPAMGGYPQQGTVAAGGTAGAWNSQPTGHTLSTNLWQ